GMVMPRFVNQALAQQPITVYGDGTQTRTFTHVRDVTEAVIRVLKEPDAIGGGVNIWGGEEGSGLSLAERVEEKEGSNTEIKFVPYDEVYSKAFEDIPRRVPSTDKLKQLIGFVPKMDLEQILDDTIDYYRSRVTS